MGAGAGALTAIVSGLMAYMDEQDAIATAKKIQDEASARFGSLDDNAIKEAAKKFLPPTMLASITTNPEYTTAEHQALNNLKDISDRGGLSLADKAVQEDAMARSAGADTARRASLQQNFANRGLGGSYAELAGQLQSQQSTANRDAQTGLQAAGSAQQRALDAIRARGSLGMQLQQQEYGQKSDAARAQDAINNFNVNKQSRDAQNQWNNQFNVAQAQGGIATGQANNAMVGGQIKANAVAGAGGQLGRFATMAGNAFDASGPSDTYHTSETTGEGRAPPGDSSRMPTGGGGDTTTGNPSDPNNKWDY